MASHTASDVPVERDQYPSGRPERRDVAVGADNLRGDPRAATVERGAHGGPSCCVTNALFEQG